MNLWLPIIIVTVAAATYRILEKVISISTQQSPFITAAIIGGVEMLVALILWLALGRDATGVNVKSLSLAVAIGLSVVAIDAGFLFAFLRGGDLAKVTVWTGAGTVLILVLVGLIVFREHFTPLQWLGVGLGLIAMALLRVG